MTSVTASEILGLGTGYTQAELKAAYRQKASQHHPDKGGDGALFDQVRKAYEMLKLCEKCLGTGKVERREGALIRRSRCDCKNMRS
jgi:DnaJ-class molecular chaperone